MRPRVLPSSTLPLVIPGYTKDVKTAISLPDDTYAQASRRAAELGISRSEFFARAARRYLDELASQSLTQQIDDALQTATADDSNAAAAAASTAVTWPPRTTGDPAQQHLLGRPWRGARQPPAKRRPVLVIQSEPFNASRLNTIVAAVITSNTALAVMPGNVFVPAAVSGLPKDSVVNVTALVTLNKTDLESPAYHLPESLMNDVSRGLRRVLGL